MMSLKQGPFLREQLINGVVVAVHQFKLEFDRYLKALEIEGHMDISINACA